MAFRGGNDHLSGLNHVQLNYGSMQKVQDTYSMLTNLFIFCVNSEGERITEMSGNPNDITRILGLVEEHRIEAVLRQVLTSSVEEQVVEDSNYSNIKLASVAVRVNGKLAFCWFVCAVLEDVEDKENAVLNIRATTTNARFISALDLLREISQKVYQNSDLLESAVAESKRSRYSELEMAKSLRRSEAIAEIVKLLDSDDGFENICSQILKETGLYTQVSYGFVLRPGGDGASVDILGSYFGDVPGRFADLSDQKRLEILSTFGDKPAVVSHKTKIDDNLRRIMDEHGISGYVSLPIFINHVPAMYAVFLDTSVQKNWDLDEAKFYGDAIRVLQNILTRRIQKNSLASSYKSLEAILDNVGSAIYVKDMTNGEILFANRMFKTTFAEEMQTGMITELFEENLNRATIYTEVEYKARSRWYDLHTTVIQWVDGRKVTLFSIFDVTEKKLYQRKIEQQANNDFLTGLYNRMSCERDLLSYIDEAKITGKKGAVLYLDLDDFKHINDGLGHQYGDVLLKAISHSLQRIEGVENSCYRMGGDEFVVIIPPQSYEKFTAIIEEIQIVFNKPWFLKGADYYCTSSMGIVTFPDEGDTVQDLIRRADIAMYEAKKSGKNRTAYYAENSDKDSNKRLDMEKSMRAATADGYKEFDVYFQPIVDIRRGNAFCTGAEALIRWNSQDMGFMNPGEFIPLAEYLGLINPIGNYVLKEACKACKQWNESGHPYYKVNVNLSVVQLLQNDIVESIQEILEETGINPRNLTLEVTESLAINDIARMKKILSSIKKLGVRIALDDFGTGYSSLNHVRELPIDVIKVDQSFVTELATDQYAQAFVKMVGELASALGVKVCVEGIETVDQFRILDDMNIRMVQGFYFDKPMPRLTFESKYVNVAVD